MESTQKLDLLANPNVVLVGVGTHSYRPRLFVPSVENFFGQFQNEFIVFDSGCHSSLLYLKEGEIPSLYAKFAPEKFHWSIDLENHLTPVLNLRSKSDSEIEVKLAQDIFPNTTFTLPNIRFQICLEDGEKLLELKVTFRDSLHFLQLQTWCDKAKEIKKMFDLDLSPRRKYAILGLDILNQNSSSLHQISNNADCICIVFSKKQREKNEAIIIPDSLISKIRNLRVQFLLSKHGKMAQNFGDEDHCGDPFDPEDPKWNVDENPLDN